MPRKTDILVYLEDELGKYCDQYFRVKLDKNKFPYIVIDNEKILIKGSDITELTGPWGFSKYNVTSIVNKDKLEDILSNKELTVDKLSIKQLFR